MNTPVLTYIVLAFPLAFILHDAEEIVVQHRWMLAHEKSMIARFPKLKPMIYHLLSLDTQSFAVAAVEELLLLLVATAYYLWGGFCSFEIISAFYLAFSFHLVVHLGQATIFREYVPDFVSSLMLLLYSAIGVYEISDTLDSLTIALCCMIGIVAMVVNLKFAHWLGKKCKSLQNKNV